MVRFIGDDVFLNSLLSDDEDLFDKPGLFPGLFPGLSPGLMFPFVAAKPDIWPILWKIVSNMSE